VAVGHRVGGAVWGPTEGGIGNQGQVRRSAQIRAGYSLGEADLLRRAMGKKKKAEMDQQRARFLAGAAERGVDPSTATLLFDRMEKFAGYGFNKSHAMPYALIAYQTAWLKANAPVEFFAGSMSLDISNTDKLAVFYQDAKRFSVPVRAPDVNRSGADFEVEEGEVLYALGAIRNVGGNVVDAIGRARTEKKGYTDFADFLRKVDAVACNRPVLSLLLRHVQ